jgi:hypothetical protein
MFLPDPRSRVKKIPDPDKRIKEFSVVENMMVYSPVARIKPGELNVAGLTIIIH